MRAVAAIRRPGAAAARLRSALTPGPRMRRRALAVLALAALLTALYLLWLRDSSLVAVDEVTVTGVTTRDGERVRSALTATAETMTTLHVDVGRLERAAAAFPAVAAVEAVPDFPNGLVVRVTEHRPVALLQGGHGQVPVAADGSILAGLSVDGELPAIPLRGSLPDRRLGPGAALDAARVAGAAPAVIARRLDGVRRDDRGRGVVAQVEDGPEIVFGDAERLAAKWAAAVRVLADEEAAGAAYVDVRIPARPVAGGFAVDPAYTQLEVESSADPPPSL
ncbi:MAG: cell division protein FtsQ/DivIB [Thermoleophilaceae bacterium]